MLEGQGWCSKLPQADCERWYRSKREARLGVHGLESVFFCEWSGGKCGSAAPVSCEPLSAGTAGAKPNLLFFLTDDWSFEMWPGRTEEEAQPQGMRELLPRLSATFVDDGLSLERHYTTFVCVPSRHSFLSGRLPHHLDLTNNLCRGLPLEMDTIADRLKAAGYVTHFVGKWNVGVASSRLLPAQRGFDSTLGFLQHAHHHFKHTDVSLDEGEPPLYDFSSARTARTSASAASTPPSRRRSCRRRCTRSAPSRSRTTTSRCRSSSLSPSPLRTRP